MVTKVKRILSFATSAVMASAQLLSPVQAVSAADRVSGISSENSLIGAKSEKAYPTPYFTGSKIVVEGPTGETVPLSIMLNDEDMSDEAYFKSASIIVALDARLAVKGVRKGETDGTSEMSMEATDLGYISSSSARVYNIAVAGTEDVGRNGVFATFDVLIPADSRPGDVFWIDVCRVSGYDSYWSGSSDKYNFNNSGFINHVINHAISGEKNGNDFYLAGTQHEGYVAVGEKIVYGDTNDDGMVDALDAKAVQNYVEGVEFQNIDLKAADVNGDGIITMDDAQLILHQYKLLSTGNDGLTFPYTGEIPWKEYQPDTAEYRFFDHGITWNDAKEYCETLGGHLVTISSQDEMDTILSLLGEKETRMNNYWLGIYKDDAGEYQTVTGEPFEYSNWNPGAPNGGGGQNAVSMFGNDYPSWNAMTGKWDDMPDTGNCGNEFCGTENFGFICEYDRESDIPVTTTAPAPTTTTATTSTTTTTAKPTTTTESTTTTTTTTTSTTTTTTTTTTSTTTSTAKPTTVTETTITETETEPATTEAPVTTAAPAPVVNTYLVFDMGMSWADAKAYCERLGGHLAVITSEEEQNAVKNAIQISSSEKSYFWLGGKRNDDGVFEWVTGEPMAYTNWSAGEPNNTDNNEPCIMSYKGGAWNDTNELSNTGVISDMGFICEWENGRTPVTPPESTEPPAPRRLDIDGEMKVTEMNLQQIKAAGIDLEDPSNYHVFKYEIKMEFEAEVFLINKYDIQPVDVHGSGGGGGTYYDIVVNGESVPVVQHTETEHEEMFMIIRGECKWLKEFYDVELLVFNRDELESLTDCSAELNVPKGLTLMNCEANQSLGTLAPRSAFDVHWYVRGDVAGDYDLTSVFKGKNCGEEFKYDFKSQNTLHVYAGNALKMTIELPKYSAFGTDYMATIIFENVSDKPIYNIQHTIFNVTQGSKLVKRKYTNGELESETEQTTILQDIGVNQSYDVGQLNPGDKIVAEVTIHDIWKSILQQEIEDKKLAADWIVLLTCWSKNPYLVGINTVASIYSTILENIVVVHVLKNVSVATLPGSTTQIPYEVIVIDNSDEHATDLLREVAEDLVLDMIGGADNGYVAALGNTISLYRDVRNAESLDDLMNAWTDYNIALLDSTGIVSAIKTLGEDYFYRFDDPQPGTTVSFYTLRREVWPINLIKSGEETCNQDFDIEVLSGEYTVDEEGRYVFTTGGVVKVTPKTADIDANICLRSSDGKQSQTIGVHTVDKHDCSGEYIMLAPPSDGDGAVVASFCDTCNGLIDCTFLHKDATAFLRNGHSYQDIRDAIEGVKEIDDKILYICGNVNITEDTKIPDDVTLVIAPETVITENGSARLIDDGEYKDFSGYNYDLRSDRPVVTTSPAETTDATTTATVTASAESISTVPVTTATDSSDTEAVTTTTDSSSQPIIKPEVVTGDINEDGMIDSSDASLILTHYADISTGSDGIFTSRQKHSADINNDGKIDSSDASVVLGYYAYISTNDEYITILDFLQTEAETQDATH